MNPPLTSFLDLTTMKKVKRIFVAVAGVTVLAVGIAMVVLPGPAFIVIPAGLAILAIEFAWARRWLRSTKDFVKRSGRFISGNRGNTNFERPKIGSSLPPVIEPTHIESDALSRFEGEGGRQAPLPVGLTLRATKGEARGASNQSVNTKPNGDLTEPIRGTRY